MSLLEQISNLHLVGVAIGAGLGAVCRGGLDANVIRRVGVTRLPWATLTVNVVGSLILGLVLGWSAAVVSASGVTPGQVQDALTAELIIGTGFAGGLTTFSTFSWESFRLVNEGRARSMVSYAVLTIVLTFAAVALGLFLGRQPG